MNIYDFSFYLHCVTWQAWLTWKAQWQNTTICMCAVTICMRAVTVMRTEDIYAV